MNQNEQRLVIGSLLHDIGKLLYRYNDGRNHSVSGYEYLKNIDILSDEEEILNCVRYHHGGMLKNAKVENNALCYITYIADNIAASVDRREKEDGVGGFVREVAYESVFNILNNNTDKFIYRPSVMSVDSINYPLSDSVGIRYDESFYGRVLDNIKDSIRGIDLSDKYINSLLQLLEANLINIPSSTNTGELVDISLYDHVKLTAAFALCIKYYLDESKEYNYKEVLFNNANKFYSEKAFCLYSIDLSGIQSFIYNISSKSALKGLRARSFYLEILLESSVDELLSRTGLCRANVLYTGGGHTYIIAPATEKVSSIIADFMTELNEWLRGNFDIGLYAAFGFADCSADDLKNKPTGSYKSIFNAISKSISANKLHRYSCEDILKLNNNIGNIDSDYSRECVICHRLGELNEANECSLCSGLKNMSDMIINKRDSFFAIFNNQGQEGVALPFGHSLRSYSWDKMKKAMADEVGYVRAYSKNTLVTGDSMASNLWVGDYSAEKEFAKLIEKSDGIKRLGVIRADVDNLGQAFVEGFAGKDNGKYETISRTSVLSRKLSMYFKQYVNVLLENGEYQLYKDKTDCKRNAVVIYSGGDDLFIVGGWDDIICFSVDLYRSFKKYSQGTLTFSAGIGIYGEKYPISEMATMTGMLEDMAKKYNQGCKNSVALFDDNNVYRWEDFINNVLGEKLEVLGNFISVNGEHNKAMFYNMLELIRDKNDSDRLNVARLAYMLARLKPKKDNVSEQETENYNKFSKSIYSWIQNKEDCKQLTTAIYIFIYMTREREDVKYE